MKNLKNLVLLIIVGALIYIIPACAKAKRKVLYIDSYHQGYEWSDGITKGVESIIIPSGNDLKIFRMDTKKNPSDDFKKSSGLKAKSLIEEYNPDVVIVSDDNAVEFIIVPYFKNKKLPFVFCGVNWDALLYGLPCDNVTGMVEVSMTMQILNNLQEFAKGKKIGYLSADTETEKKNLASYEKFFKLRFDKEYFVKNFADWKNAFLKLQNETNLIIFENNAGITDWKNDEAEAYALANTKVPVGTTNPWIMNYALLGITKVAEEQGEWAAKAALEILAGKSPKDIPVVKNKKGKFYVNIKMAKKLNIQFEQAILDKAEKIN